MAKTLIDVPDDVMAKAMEVSHQATKRGTVLTALEQMIRADAQREYRQALLDGVVDDLGDPDVIASAQR